jgi:hypothetical protein
MLQAERRALPAETSRARKDRTQKRVRRRCRRHRRAAKIREEEIDPCAALGVSAGWPVDTRASYRVHSLTADDTDDNEGEELEPLPAVVVRHLCGEPRLRPIDLSRTDPTDPKAEANPHHNSARMHACMHARACNASVCARARVKPACVKLRACTRAFIAHTVRGGRRQWGLGPCVRPQQRLARSRML